MADYRLALYDNRALQPWRDIKTVCIICTHEVLIQDLQADTTKTP